MNHLKNSCCSRPLPYKSLVAIILLTLVFGPLGLAYSSSLISILLLALVVIVGLLPVDHLAWILLIIYLGEIYLGVYLVNRYNRRLSRTDHSEN